MEDSWLPLFVRVEGWKVAVLGGGTAGSRRASLFACKGARVRVYAKSFAPGIGEECPGKIELIEVDLEDTGNLEDAVNWGDLIVIATSNPKVNRLASVMALERGKLVNSAADYSLGNVIVPFRAETSYGLKIAVTSLGKTGIATRKILEDIIKIIDNEYYKTLFRVMARIKDWLKNNIKDYKLRYNLYFILGESPRVLQYINRGEEDKAFEEALKIINEYLTDNSESLKRRRYP
ncbi:MAG: bifunctional precorrin-2 dehydrogenase/sirohydrochlorin ferrochelatase [Desulfurococcales archaeon]|nr:bifunctional precorrin-2 dehydrogenase/sirohydrochlorin ferrochelatase [Desulfurococcales archaeon]